MENNEKGMYALAAVRILIGWIILWGFVDKLFGLGFQTPADSGIIDGESPSSFLPYVTGGAFKGLFDSIAGNFFADVLLMAALLILGVCCMLGIASKLTTVFTVAFMVAMYLLHVPPLDNPLVDYHLILAAAVPAIYWLGGFGILSLEEKWKETPLVKRFPILG